MEMKNAKKKQQQKHNAKKMEMQNAKKKSEEGEGKGGLRSKLGSFNPGYFFSKIVKNWGKKQKKWKKIGKKKEKKWKKLKKREKKSNLRRVPSQEVGPYLPD